MPEFAFRNVRSRRWPLHRSVGPALLLPVSLCALLASACGSDVEVSSVTPSSGSARGGQKVIVHGEGFGSSATVSFDGVPARAVRRVSDTELEVTTPTLLACTADVKVASDGDEATLSNGFTFLPLNLRFVEAPAHYLPAVEDLAVADVAVADFDRDGDPDLFLAGANAPSSLLRNSGTGSFNPAPSGVDAGVEAGAEAGTEAGVADAGTLDGPADASPADASSPDASPPDAGTNPSLASMANDVRKVLADDFDRDGDIDLFLCNGGGEAHRVLLNDGKGSFTGAADGVALGADDCRDAALIDTDGDGRQDVVILGKGRIGRGKTYVRTLVAGSSPLLASPKDGEPKGEVQDLPCGTVSGTEDAITGKFTFDSSSTFAGAASGKASFDFGTATGSVSFSVSVPTVRAVPSALELELEGTASGNPITLSIVDAEDEVYSADAGALSWTGWRHLKADAIPTWNHAGGDDDGEIDLPLKSVSVTLGSAPGAAKGTLRIDSILLLLPKAGWAVVEDFERRDFAASFQTSYDSLGAGDLDGDGVPDVFLGASAADATPRATVAIGERSGPASFRFLAGGAGLVPDLPDSISHASVLDADGDGDLDIAVVSDGGQDRLLVNDGRGHFFDDTLARMPLDRSHGRSASIADLDLDGLPDLSIANVGEVNRLYVNRGAKGFVDVTPALPLHAMKTLRLVPLDFDLDGDMDLFVLNQKGEASKLYVSVEPVGHD